jgi:hypothetical protein
MGNIGPGEIIDDLGKIDIGEDRVLKFLVGISLAEMESEFRSIARYVSTGEETRDRDIVVASVGTLMSMAGLKWPVILEAVSSLNKLNDDILRKSAVAVINGAYLLVNSPDDEIVTVDLKTMRRAKVENKIRPLVSVIYSCSAIWDEIDRVFGNGVGQMP